jgi:hypothetical protein
MSQYLSIRQIGLAASVVSGILLFGGHLVEESSSGEFMLIAAKNLVLLAHLAMSFTFIAIYELHPRKTGIDLLGMLLATFGTIMVSAIIIIEAAGITVQDAGHVLHASGVRWIADSGPLMFVMGMLVIGIKLMRSGANAPGGAMLTLGTLIFAAAGYSGPLSTIMVILGSALTGAGFIWAGIKMKHN